MSISLPGNLPKPSQIVESAGNVNRQIRNVLYALIRNDRVFDQMTPYLVNGGQCGHKMMDLAACVDIAVSADHAGGNHLANIDPPPNKYTIGRNLNVCLRSMYALDPAWKIVGKAKRLEHKPAAAA